MKDDNIKGPLFDKEQLLPGLGEIGDARQEQPRDTTILDKLVDCSDRIVKKHSKHIPDPDALDELEQMDGFYTGIYNEVMLALDADEVSFDESDIREFLIARSNSDLERKKSQVLGIYTGCLAQILTERNAMQGKRTVIHLDGCMSGNSNNKIKFDYLFYFARVLDTVILENFDGEEILAHAASFGGRADTLVCSGIEGGCNLFDIGTYRGKVNKAVAINIDGYCTLMGSGSNGGYVSQAIGVNLRGDACLSSCASYYGFVEQLIGVGIDGGDEFSEIGSTGNTDVINQIIAIDINGSGTLRLIGDSKSRINQVIYDGIIDTDFTEYQMSKSILCRELISGEQVRATHSSHDAQRIEKTIALIRSMKDKPYSEVIKIADQIYALMPVFPYEYFKSVGK